MYRSILVPLDGAAFGEHALPLALALARRSGATVRLVHVCPAPQQSFFAESGAADAGETAGLSRERAGAYLDQLAACLSDRWEVPITTSVLEGPAAETLHDHALASSADLVVMTTHAHGPLPRLWLGSVADALVRRLPLPILLVRPHGEVLDVLEEVHEQPFQHILIPLDGSPLARSR
jgi:nucleotide-binding universal stress UspA family protein